MSSKNSTFYVLFFFMGASASFFCSIALPSDIILSKGADENE